MILPPGDNLTKGESAYHDLVYSEAEKALGRADMWVILGYSCPDYDVDVLNLMKRALELRPSDSGKSRSIWVIAPDSEAIATRLVPKIEHSIGAYKLTFTRFVDKIFDIQGLERQGLA